MRGQCLCGDVVWEGSGAGELMHHCHCGMCRKASGAAFATMAAFPASDFRFVAGEAGVRSYESSPGNERRFCGRCGSSVPGPPFGDQVMVPNGTIDGDPGARSMAHIFVASKAPWYDIPPDGLPHFEAYPPGYEQPELFPAPARGGTAGRTGGSCLCGAVAYEFEGPIDRWYNCHCSRCRRARGGPHASNVFVSPSGFRWTRGDDQVVGFKLPEAERFGQAFCRTCGGKVPRVNVPAGYVGIPAGSLDDDPGARPQRHIFVGSKAPWFEIADDLPQSEELPT